MTEAPEMKASEIITPTPMSRQDMSAENLSEEYRLGWNMAVKAALECALETACSSEAERAYYAGVAEGTRELVRQLDVALNGNQAAPQASLVDLVVMAKNKLHAPQTALENIRLYVGKLRNRLTPMETETLLRFCEEGGAKFDPLRSA